MTSRFSLVSLSMFVTAVALYGCGVTSMTDGTGSSGASGAAGSAGSSGSSGSAGAGGTGGVRGIPCDVDAILKAQCQSCHSNPPSGGAPMALVTHADLAAPSLVDPNKSFAQRSVDRMSASVAPMPPAPASPSSASDIAAFQAWIDAGLPAGPCADGTAGAGGTGGGDPYNTPTVCTSGQTYTFGEFSGMRPGEACIACHKTEFEAPKFDIAGTVYPTAHEPDDCNGANSQTGGNAVGAVVRILDVNNTQVDIPVGTELNSVGNFYRYQGSAPALVAPFRATIMFDGRERSMSTPAASGDCNTCHTETGNSGAPGRLMLP